MSISYTIISSFLEPSLAFLSLLLQLLAICSSWWAHFTARTDLGKPEEKGHYGLWTLCSKKAPHWREDCDPLDTFFELPTFLTVSGILCILELLFLVTFIPLELLKLFQGWKNKHVFCIKSKKLRILEMAIVVSSTLIAIMAAVFATIGENRNKEYIVSKGWSFWVQVAVILLEVVLLSMCFTESYRYLRLQWQQQIDPEGKRAETYGNPSFDADSPTLPRSHPSTNATNGAIAYTESSGFPYGQNSAHEKPTDGPTVEKISSKQKVKDTLTYENECYLESSPRAERRQERLKRFEL